MSARWIEGRYSPDGEREVAFSEGLAVAAIEGPAVMIVVGEAWVRVEGEEALVALEQAIVAARDDHRRYHGG